MSSIGLIGRNEMKRIKTIRYFLIEIAFTLAMLVYITKLHGIYSPSSEFEAEFLKMLCLLTIILIWVFGPMLNRFVMLIFGGLYTFYLVSQDVYKRAFQQYYHFSTAKDLIGEVWGEKASAFEFIKFTTLKHNAEPEKCEMIQEMFYLKIGTYLRRDKAAEQT